MEYFKMVALRAYVKIVIKERAQNILSTTQVKVTYRPSPSDVNPETEVITSRRGVLHTPFL